jgi:predicted nucleotidyltransferase
VVIYGSRAKGTFKPASDIDLTLLGEKLNLTIQYKIENDLDDLMLPYLFDISIFNQISNTDLVEHINRVGIVFFERS